MDDIYSGNSFGSVLKLAAAVSDAARTALWIDRSKLAFDVGVRAALGLAITLVVGRATGHTAAGVVAAIGALNAGFVSLQGTYRSRAMLTMVAAAGMGLAEFIGATVGHLVGPLAVTAAAVGFVAGLAVALGPGPSIVGLQAVIVLVVFSQFRFSAEVAARNAGLIILGAAVQVLLVVLPWPLRRFPAERRALEDVYSQLASFARQAVTDERALLEPGAFDQLTAVMRDPQPFGGDELVARRALAVQADRLRLELVALNGARQRLKAGGLAEPVRDLEELLSAAAAVLDEVAEAARASRPAVGWEPQRDRFEASLARLQASAELSGDREATAVVANAAERAEAVAGQLRTALRACAALAGNDPGAVEIAALTGRVPAVPRRRPTGWVAERIATLRSNLTLSSQSFRHALRLSATLAAAVLVSDAFSLAHRYWVPLTATLVLRPDFKSTITRGLSRVGGTLAGAGLVTLVLAEARPDPDWLIAIVIVLFVPAVTLVQANYAIYSVVIASLVVTLVAFEGQPGTAAAGERSVYTVIGAALALTAYMLWPTWEASSLPDTLARLSEVEGRYARQVLLAWANPSGADRSALQQSRLEARLARTDAEAAVARWAGEPRQDGERPVPPGFIASVRMCVSAILGLHAELPPDGTGYPGAAVLAEDTQRALLGVATKLRNPSAEVTLPALREEQVALRSAAEGAAKDDPTRLGESLALAAETDRLVNSVNTLAHLVGIDEKVR
jgi:uncharacterized membrane protein YccC